MSIFEDLKSLVIVVVICLCLYGLYRVKDSVSSTLTNLTGGVNTITGGLKVAFDPKIPGKKPCDAGERDDGTSCWLDTYGNGAGSIPLKRACDNGQRDDGTSCWLDSYGRGAGYPWQFGDGLNLDGAYSRCNAQNSQGCETWGAIVYPKCAKGYHNEACCICAPEGGPGIRKTLFDRQYCADGQTNVAGLCYNNCKVGFEYVGGSLCQPIGGPHITKTAFERYQCPPTDAPEYTQLAGALCYKPTS